ncbi:Insulin-like growth factor binding protein, N-terminal [Pseudocohnilembus persalinus]|uniref:Insulin-like growth factor binding protein, N-terminal n=1 Tax=Pseudocohnilembus persalinus TaxID=266149 RepID=A0A0V0R7G6_PSEPJ|nr:Insulin-like growth factor binding protein, N-terminal [Pseudocohnilembus persalinus]|eukprot:KRX10411.1 Insulin-like growth factor binding protein, N-terminal [Pseudocohnilembus persalinus]
MILICNLVKNQDLLTPSSWTSQQKTSDYRHDSSFFFKKKKSDRYSFVTFNNNNNYAFIYPVNYSASNVKVITQTFDQNVSGYTSDQNQVNFFSNIDDSQSNKNSLFIDEKKTISITVIGSKTVSQGFEIFKYDQNGNKLCYNHISQFGGYDFSNINFGKLDENYIWISGTKENNYFSKDWEQTYIFLGKISDCSLYSQNAYTDMISLGQGFSFTNQQGQIKMLIFYDQISVCPNFLYKFLDNNDCNSCKGNFRDHTNSCECQIGYYDDGDVNFICKQCDQGCGNLGCKKETGECINCIGLQGEEFTRILQDQCSCPVKYYDDIPNNDDCQKCFERCGDQGCSQYDDCNDCIDLYILGDGNCNKCIGDQGKPYSRIFTEDCGCPVGYYEDYPHFDNCQQCFQRCGHQGCIYYDDCNNCIDLYTLGDGSCNKCIGDPNQPYSRIFSENCGCPVGYYDDFPSNDNCQQCFERCGDQGCSYYDDCNNCVDLYSIGDGNCNQCIGEQGKPFSRIFSENCSCPVGFYDNYPKQKNCQKCSILCGNKGCGSNPFQCYNCISGYYLKNQECFECPEVCHSCHLKFEITQKDVIEQMQQRYYTNFNFYHYSQAFTCTCPMPFYEFSGTFRNKKIEEYSYAQIHDLCLSLQEI